MRRRRFVLAAASCTAVGAVAAVSLTPPVVTPLRAQAPAAPADAAHLKALYGEKCSACHDLPDPQEKGYSRAEWQRTVSKMVTRYKATNFTPAEGAQIVSYLATFAPRAGRTSAPSTPWATDADDVWSFAPSATRVFNFEAASPLAALMPMTAGTPGPAAVWHTVPGTQADGTVVKVVPARPAASRFALLLDRGDQGHNLDVRVRFQIQAGTVSPAVGIAFGVADPKTYCVLRYDALHDTLSLLQIREPTHTALQQTPVTLPASEGGQDNRAAGRTAGLTSPPKPAGGWHTLRLLVKDGQVRGWIDMQKRISFQDGAYTGGKVGLWAQGDTVALFDDWTVDLYDAPPPPAPGLDG